ncbi:hypothetical protein [Paraburkholderia pallida]|nr:hypothetical protein [Paraburkholderia pallida]
MLHRTVARTLHASKVCVSVAVNQGMACEYPKPPENQSIWAEARALEASIRAIRRAQGKKNPEDFPPRSPECLAAMNEFVRDVCRALEIDPDTLGDADDDADDLYGAGAAG